ncbi:MAG TPA: sigma-70 family RNA polymerase sigma factor [Candidatus Polarisedimenticolia bacterium]|jgi:RNA polymerase sigma-70 factor (ECF subfamily)|nr:sigma-70 family RNA polymerase sigma factor [Candidatus Polarisedimenticolia bacterium]
MLEAMPLAGPQQKAASRTIEVSSSAGGEGADEATLVALARAGDRAAFDTLVAFHLERVWALVWRVLRHQEDTEDVVQEVFLTAWRGLAGFRGEARLATWLQTIAVSRALNHRARSSERRRRQTLPLDTAEAASAADPRPAASPLRLLEAGDLRRRLGHCLDRLPEPWRAVLALRDGGTQPYDAIAASLGLALGTVRSRLARARLALRDCLEGRS